ncbi:deoxyribodipyrimidine photo-lyase [Paracoccus halophilus]|uniref:DNA photolyase n=1 Tax=Paracoccus halophilus TaxID=376733 RepID=A0A099F506_9RHOB|nr:deoxyribodipyrimidine photo-lyase [Paracoccus halophilus]KGJ05830.1 DNA photolyase [Paracoccus halophilus]SFA40849.1 deoxyribodipyrimidine photo-lyase [Paracoccus halophilus]
MTTAPPGIFWLTRDFRLADNAALRAAITDGPLLPVFIIDRLTLEQGAASRWRLGRALAAFDAALRARSGGRGVSVLRGEADELLPVLMQRLGARRLHQSDWPTPGMRALQARLRAALRPIGGDLVLHQGHLLLPPAALRNASGGAFRVYSPFARALRRIGADRPAPDAPARITGFAALPDDPDPARLDLAPDLHRGRAALERFALPAGEAAAQARLAEFLDRAEDYADGRDRPDLNVTSGLSEHLALGEIGPRTLWAMAAPQAELISGQAQGIAKFLSEVIWREFAWHLLIEFPQMTDTCWRPEWQRFPWQKDGPGLTQWRRAETGVALVDAGLREMWVTGRMHNRVRMVAASWLTKHLLTDWRAGLAHFADCLTDWDPASNAMNWQWVAGCGPDAAPYFRIFNPDLQARRYDPDAAYRRRWLAGTGSAGTSEARAWLDTVPRAWQVKPCWQPGPPSALSAGRKAALAALTRFRALRPEN